MLIPSVATSSKQSLAASLPSLRRGVRPPKSNGPAQTTTSRFLRIARAFSSSADAPDDEKSHFPWRHDPALPDRVLRRDDYSGTYNPTTRDPPLLRRIIAARELNISAWDVLPIPFHEHEWEVELAGNFAVAFGFAMEELLRALFRVPVKNENGVISVDSSAEGNIDGNCIDGEMPSTEDNECLNGMMDKKLLQRYRIDPTKMQLKFSLRPMEAKLQHIFAVPVPGLTREIAESDPYIRGCIYRLHAAYDENGFDEHYFDLLTDFAKHGPDKRTVIAEAAIKCMEFFQVKDTSSGHVVQGMEDGSEEEEAVHIVRFEVVTDGSGEGEEREVGNWKITDVDDLLEGNLFH